MRPVSRYCSVVSVSLDSVTDIAGYPSFAPTLSVATGWRHTPHHLVHPGEAAALPKCPAAPTLGV